MSDQLPGRSPHRSPRARCHRRRPTGGSRTTGPGHDHGAVSTNRTGGGSPSLALRDRCPPATAGARRGFRVGRRRATGRRRPVERRARTASLGDRLDHPADSSRSNPSRRHCTAHRHRRSTATARMQSLASSGPGSAWITQRGSRRRSQPFGDDRGIAASPRGEDLAEGVAPGGHRPGRNGRHVADPARSGSWPRSQRHDARPVRGSGGSDLWRVALERRPTGRRSEYCRGRRSVRVTRRLDARE